MPADVDADVALDDAAPAGAGAAQAAPAGNTAAATVPAAASDAVSSAADGFRMMSTSGNASCRHARPAGAHHDPR